MPPRLELAGMRFGRLIVLEVHDQDAGRAYRWKCRCDCGAEAIVRGGHLKAGVTQSCGCGIREAASRPRTHGQAHTPLYKRWRAMIERTRNPNASEYHNYGGRGIKVCDQWQSFEAFAADMGATFDEVLTLERRNVNGDYSPENCYWATTKQQTRNRRNNHVIEWSGRRMVVTDWAELLGLKPNTLIYRLRRGWQLERALTTGANPEALLALANGPTSGGPVASGNYLTRE
ncbi:hypothetical protein [Streptomyces prasinus]